MDTAELIDRLGRTELFRDAPERAVTLCLVGSQAARLAAGDVLIGAGSRSGSLFLLLEGRVEVRLRGHFADVPMAELGPGEVLGEIHVVTGQPATADVVATVPCTVLEIPGDLARAIGDAFAAFDERLAQLASRRLRSVVFRRALGDLLQGLQPALLDEFIPSFTEVLLPRGETLFSQGEVADAWYVLTSGRLSVHTAAEAGHKIADLMPGASVGEIAVITGGTRNATVKAERDASLMRVSRDSFERFADGHPTFARRLMETVVRRFTDTVATRRAGTPVLVVLRASANPALDEAFRQLGQALERSTGAAVLTRASLEAAVGCRIDATVTAAHPLWSRMDVWLEEAQRQHPLVVVDAGHADDAWRYECLVHADRCLWLAEPVPDDAFEPDETLGQALRGAREWLRRDTRRLPWWLVLAHPPGTAAPSNTRAWLAEGNFDRHLHLRIGDTPSMERAARLISGRGTGVALSGGGARGLAHIGVLKAFVEMGVPIDCIGGTSIGAIQAGMFAMGLTIERMRSLNLEVIAQRPFSEYTLPVVAMVASKRRDACSQHSFGDVRIEDLWIPYLAVSTDLCAACPVVHESGSLGLAASASSALPGVLVPVIDGDRLLVDGGVVNNLPADLVKQRCGGAVYGVKATPSDDLVVPAGGFPSAWRFALHGLVPGMPRISSPRLGDLLVRTMTVSSAELMAETVRQVDVLIEPKVEAFGMLQFGAIDALIEAGYDAGMAALREGELVGRTGIEPVAPAV